MALERAAAMHQDSNTQGSKSGAIATLCTQSALHYASSTAKAAVLKSYGKRILISMAGNAYPDKGVYKKGTRKAYAYGCRLLRSFNEGRITCLASRRSLPV